VRANLGGLEGEHDSIAGNSGADELLGDALLRSVMLNPDLVVPDVDMKNRVLTKTG
jgi:hypothetical protein